MDADPRPHHDTAWAALAAHASADHGLVHRDHAIAIAGSPTRVRRWVATGRLERVAPAVLRITGSPGSWECSLRAGLLSLGPDALVSHDAAAQLLGFDRTPPDQVHFLVPRSRRRTFGFGTLHSTTRLLRSDRTVVRDFPCTTATRTVLDLADVGAGRRRVEAAIDSAVRSRRSSPVVLHDRLATLRGHGRRWVRLIDDLLLDSGGESPLERRFLSIVRTAGLPRPDTQFTIRSEARFVARADFVWRAARLVVEVSGQLGHSAPSERARDAQRRNELQAEGWVVFEFTYRDVMSRPDHVIRTVAARLLAPDVQGT